MSRTVTEMSVRRNFRVSFCCIVPTFVEMMAEMSSYEVNDYVRLYMGDSKHSNEFARQFVAKRISLRSQNNNKHQEVGSRTTMLLLYVASRTVARRMYFNRTSGDQHLPSIRARLARSSRASRRTAARPATPAPTTAAARSAARRCRRSTRASWASRARRPQDASTSARSTRRSERGSTRLDAYFPSDFFLFA